MPYDGPGLAMAAPVRAEEYGDAPDEDVTAVTVVPENERYARETKWVGPGGPFDAREVIADRHEEVTKLAPDASFLGKRADGSASEGSVANAIRRLADEEDAPVVFLGSEDAGRTVVPVSPVGGAVAADASYDVHPVRHRAPTEIDAIDRRSDFYLTD